MPLPDLIEIIPLSGPVRAQISVPGSKSITNRALILAGLAEGETSLEGALWSEDTQVLVECLQELGFMINVRPDPNEACNRTITIYGKGGAVPRGGTMEQPLELFVGNAGTTARFLAAFLCLGNGFYRLHGVERMHERPQRALFCALRELGYAIHSENDRLPVIIEGSGPRASKCTVSIEDSSQFASALLLCSGRGCWEIQVVGENAEESPYVAMTSKLIEAFPSRGGVFQIEPDASSGSYFVAAGFLESEWGDWQKQEFPSAGTHGFALSTRLRPVVEVRNWPRSGWQIDSRFPDFCGLLALTRIPAPPDPALPVVVKSPDPAWLKQAEALQQMRQSSLGESRVRISRRHDLGDSIMTLIVLTPLLYFPIQFTDLGRLRSQECERVLALKTELTRCGVKALESDDTLEVFPSKPHGAEIETYNDHRIAMCFAILGLKIPGIKIKNPGCVKKTFPNFFQKLAAQPPNGLGATLRDGRSGRALEMERLFAE